MVLVYDATSAWPLPLWFHFLMIDFYQAQILEDKKEGFGLRADSIFKFRIE